MALHEQNREDLLREATALVRRVEIRIGESESIVVGFRRDGSGSLFLGGDPVFQFNKYNQLRRGFWNGKLIKAENGNLIELTRVRTSAEVQLRRRDLEMAETEAFVELFREVAQQILTAIDHNELTIVGQVPVGQNVIGSVSTWLANVSQDVQVAARPNVS